MYTRSWNSEGLNESSVVLWKVFFSDIQYLEFVMYSICSVIIKQLHLHQPSVSQSRSWGEKKKKKRETQKAQEMNIFVNSMLVFFPHSTDILDLEHKLHNPGHQGWNPVFIQKGTLRQLERKCYMYEKKAAGKLTKLIWAQERRLY